MAEGLVLFSLLLFPWMLLLLGKVAKVIHRMTPATAVGARVTSLRRHKLDRPHPRASFTFSISQRGEEAPSLFQYVIAPELPFISRYFMVKPVLEHEKEPFCHAT